MTIGEESARKRVESQIELVLISPGMFDANPHVLQGRIEGLLTAWAAVIGRSIQINERLDQLRGEEIRRVYAAVGKRSVDRRHDSIAEGFSWKSPPWEACDLTANSYAVIWRRLNNAIDALGSLVTTE